MNIEPIREQKRNLEPITEMHAWESDVRTHPPMQTALKPGRLGHRASSTPTGEENRSIASYSGEPPHTAEWQPPLVSDGYDVDPSLGDPVPPNAGSGRRRVYFYQPLHESSSSARSTEAQHGSSPEFLAPEDSYSSTPPCLPPRGRGRERVRRVPATTADGRRASPEMQPVSRRTSPLDRVNSDVITPQVHLSRRKRDVFSPRRESSYPQPHYDDRRDSLPERPTPTEERTAAYHSQQVHQRERSWHEDRDHRPEPFGWPVISGETPRYLDYQKAQPQVDFPHHGESDPDSEPKKVKKGGRRSAPRPVQKRSHSLYEGRREGDSTLYFTSDSEPLPDEDAYYSPQKSRRQQRPHSARSRRRSSSSYWADQEDSYTRDPRSSRTADKPPLKPKDPPKYKGGKSDVQDFLVQFNLIREYNQWSYRDAGFELASSLEEGARSVINSLPRSKQCDYDSLCLALRSRFQPPGRERKSAVGIWERAMQKGEDAFSYANVLRQMEKEAYPGAPLGDVTMMALYVNGLRDPEMKRYVRRCNPKSFEEAVEIAARDEADAGSTAPDRARKPKPEMVAKVSSNSAPPKQDANTVPPVTTEPSPMEERLRKLEQGSPDLFETGTYEVL